MLETLYKIRYQIEGTPATLFRRVSVKKFPSFSDLEGIDLYPKLFFSPRDQKQKRVALGSLISFSNPPSIETLDEEEGPPLRIWGGIPFYGHLLANSQWPKTFESHFFIPQFEWIQGEEETLFIENSLSEEGFDPIFYKKELSIPPLLYFKDKPEKNEYFKILSHLKEKLSSKEIEKVVLAKEKKLFCRGPIPPFHLLENLSLEASHSYLLAYQPSVDCAFMSLSPERLYKREEKLLKTEALAGTAPHSLEEDFLLKSKKNIHEIDLVKRYLLEKLNLISKDVKVPSRYDLLKLQHVTHLYLPFEANLKKDISDAHLLHLLHPTPSLLGLPREKARSLLLQHEPFDRGWYGSPIGWIEQKNSEFIVGIRSALIQGSHISLFSGGGIVLGSSENEEWEEAEMKLKNYHCLLKYEP